MPDLSENPPKDCRLEAKLPDSAQNMVRRVQAGQVRMLRARATREQAYWRALTLLGVVGWSVTVPTLAGVALGIWIDRVWPSRFSWTLTFLFIGLTVGCLNAWMHIKNDPKV
jgi:ATP synthase protein I